MEEGDQEMEMKNIMERYSFTSTVDTLYKNKTLH